MQNSVCVREVKRNIFVLANKKSLQTGRRTFDFQFVNAFVFSPRKSVKKDTLGFALYDGF